MKKEIRKVKEGVKGAEETMRYGAGKVKSVVKRAGELGDVKRIVKKF